MGPDGKKPGEPERQDPEKLPCFPNRYLQGVYLPSWKLEDVLHDRHAEKLRFDLTADPFRGEIADDELVRIDSNGLSQQDFPERLGNLDRDRLVSIFAVSKICCPDKRPLGADPRLEFLDVFLQ